MKRFTIRLAIGLAVFAAALGGAVIAVAAPLPTGETGSEADALAERMQLAVDAHAWEHTGVVQWTFGGRNEHLWDRDRHLDRVRWDDTEVLLDLTTQQGRAFKKGRELEGRKRAKALERAWASWCNDSFWLNPVVKAFDEGTTRALVHTDSGDALLVSYESGGVTPGDAYLWLLDDAGLPTAWQMWVQIVPVKGMEVGWSGWTSLATGARVSTEHVAGPMTLRITDLAGETHLADLVGDDDPFDLLFADAASHPK